MSKLFISFSLSLVFNVLFSSSLVHALTTYNVLSYGAKGNGVTDSTQAFIDAWGAACACSGPSRIYVPKGRYFIGPLAFKGGCNSSDITILIDGTLIGPVDYGVLSEAKNWVSFDGVDGVSIVGGAFDAKGSSLWACKASDKNNCPDGATVISSLLLLLTYWSYSSTQNVICNEILILL